jgi:hypothetical protein
MNIQLSISKFYFPTTFIIRYVTFLSDQDLFGFGFAELGSYALIPQCLYLRIVITLS